MLATAALVLMMQSAQPVSMETRTLHVSITDQHGRPILDVAPEDLVVIEDGVARDVVRVTPDARKLTLALIVDTSSAMSTHYRLQVCEPLVALLKGLPGRSHYAIWTTGERPTKILDFTDDLGLAASALRRVALSGGSTLFDAIDEALQDLAAREGERLAVVVVPTSGPEFSSREKPRALENAELRGGAVVYSILAHDGDTLMEDAAPALPTDAALQPRYGNALETLARESGGLFDELLSFMGVERVLSRIAADLAGAQVLSYRVPVGSAPSKTQVEVARPALRVRVLERRR